MKWKTLKVRLISFKSKLTSVYAALLVCFIWWSHGVFVPLLQTCANFPLPNYFMGLSESVSDCTQLHKLQKRHVQGLQTSRSLLLKFRPNWPQIGLLQPSQPKFDMFQLLSTKENHCDRIAFKEKSFVKFVRRVLATEQNFAQDKTFRPRWTKKKPSATKKIFYSKLNMSAEKFLKKFYRPRKNVPTKISQRSFS